MNLVLDVNSSLFRLRMHDKFWFKLVTTIHHDGSPMGATYDDESWEKTLMDEFEYVMHGKVFRLEPNEADNSM